MSQSQEIATVNLIEYVDGRIESVYTWPYNPDGVKEARAGFYALGLEAGFTREQIEIGIGDGVIEDEKGFKLFLTYSEAAKNL